MSADFLARVRAEALRRIEEERFESAVIAEMRKIREEERCGAQTPAYHKFHEERKVKLQEACAAGRIAPAMAMIETAVSDYVLDNITLDEVYAIIETMDPDYPTEYAKSKPARIVINRRAERVPIAFKLYLGMAQAKHTVMASEKKEIFNSITMAAVN